MPTAVKHDGVSLHAAREVDLGTAVKQNGDSLHAAREVDLGNTPTAVKQNGHSAHAAPEVDFGNTPTAVKQNGDSEHAAREVDLGNMPTAVKHDGDSLHAAREVDLGTPTAAKQSRHRRQKAPVAAKQLPTDTCTTMAEVMECTRIIKWQRDLVTNAIKERGASKALRATAANLDLEMEACRLDAQRTVAELRGKASCRYA